MIQWDLYERKPGVWVKVNYDWITNSLVRDGLELSVDQQLDEVAKWCHDNDCGRRMAYDMFQFKNKTQLTAFMLRWS